MKLTSLIAIAALGSVYALTPVAAQNTQNTQGVDPSCMMKDSSGKDVVDMNKCPDGKTIGDAASSGSNNSTTGATNDNAAGTTPNNTTASGGAATGTDTTTAQGSTQGGVNASLFVPQENLMNATLITGSDFTGKRIYSRAGDDLGEVNDIVFSADGKVIAAILGVGGFLGMGEKDVLVSMNAIDFVKDGDSVKLVVDASKDALTGAPSFDRAKRTYLVN